MNFRQLVLLGIFACSLWALVVAGFSSLEDLQTIRTKSELPSQVVGDQLENSPIRNRFEAIVSVLNIGLPASLAGVAILILSYKTERVGLFSLLFAIACFLFCSSRALTTARTLSEAKQVPLEERVWWMS